MGANKVKPMPNENKEFDRFEAFAKKLVKVSKKEIDEAEKKRQADKKARA